MGDLLIIGDLQAKRENLQECVSLFAQIESLAKERNINTVVFLGDMLERRGLIEAECLNTLFSYFSSSNLHHYIVCGNHDQISTHNDSTALEPLKALKNVNIYDEPGQLGNILFMPYYRNPKGFLYDITLWLPRLPNTPILLCHQGIKEFTIGSGYTEDEAVNVSDLKAFKLVVAGHYHTPMNKANVVYLGSPFSHSFGESNEEKRLGILNTETVELEYIPTNFRKHMTYTLGVNDPLPAIDDKNLYRFIIEGTDDEIKNYTPLITGRNVKYVMRPKSVAQTVVISETLTHQDKWVKWAKDIKQLDDEVIQKGLELLE